MRLPQSKRIERCVASLSASKAVPNTAVNHGSPITGTKDRSTLGADVVSTGVGSGSIGNTHEETGHVDITGSLLLVDNGSLVYDPELHIGGEVFKGKTNNQPELD